jgi:hypothetical protein
MSLLNSLDQLFAVPFFLLEKCTWLAGLQIGYKKKRKIFYKSILSSGLPMLQMFRRLTWVNLMVVLRLLCPKNSCVKLTSMPASIKWVA